MTIEHRYSARHSVALDVQIHYRKRKFLSARGSNLSDQGMYLQVRCLTLAVGTMVDLEFRCLDRDWLVPAIVVHQNAQGMGVMFRDAQFDLAEALASTAMAHFSARTLAASHGITAG